MKGHIIATLTAPLVTPLAFSLGSVFLLITSSQPVFSDLFDLLTALVVYFVVISPFAYVVMLVFALPVVYLLIRLDEFSELPMLLAGLTLGVLGPSIVVFRAQWDDIVDGIPFLVACSLCGALTALAYLKIVKRYYQSDTAGGQKLVNNSGRVTDSEIR